MGLPHDLVVGEKLRLAPAVKVGGCGADVTLPMTSTLRPITLTDGVEVEAMWQQLADADWSKPLPTPLMLLLERSISAPYHAVL